ncbi:MAG: hypothetical protein ACREK1_12590, partial [Longimicrobiales bacterium]
LWLSPMGGQAQAVVGRLPERLASDMEPLTRARIVGSMISRRFSVSAIVLPGTTAAARPRVVTRLVESGWTEEPMPRQRSGGFEVAEEPERAAHASLCSPDDDNIQVSVRGHRGDSAVVLLSLISGTYSSCRVTDLERRQPYAEAPMPALRAPAGAQHRGGGTGGGPMEAYARTRLRTDLTPAALTAHYAPQLNAHGWNDVAQSVTDDVAIHVFGMTDENAEAWQGVLYVTLLPDGDRELYLRIARVQ